MNTIWQPDLSQDLVSAGRSKYQALAKAIRSAIAQGQLLPGEKLPPVRDLAWRSGVTPGTVARAYGVLVQERVLIAEVGRGTYVAEPNQALGTRPVPKSALGVADQRFWPRHTVEVSPLTAYLLSPKLPDVGQGGLIRDWMARLMQEASPDVLMRYPSRETDQAAREAFRGLMNKAPVGAFETDDIVMTHGGQSGILAVMQTVLQGNDPVVLVDELSYSGFRRAAELCRARVVGVPWDDEGPRPDAVETLARLHGAQLLCTSAEVNNPTTKTTSPARRVEIAQVAQRLGLHVLDDDCYRMGPHLAGSYRALLPELGWYVTSPSKTLTPALRIGFVIAPEGWAQSLVRTATFSSFSLSRILTDVYAGLSSDPMFGQVLDRARAQMNDRLRVAVNALGGHDILWREDTPFVWLTLPMGWRGAAFAQAAEQAGVLVKAADEFILRDGPSVHAVRIAINAQLGAKRYEDALATLRGLLDRPRGHITV